MPCKSGAACGTDESRGGDYRGNKGCKSDEMGGAYE